MTWRQWIVAPEPGPGGASAHGGPFVELANGEHAPTRCDWQAFVPGRSADSPFANVCLEVRDGKPACTSITVGSYPDGPGLTAE